MHYVLDTNAINLGDQLDMDLLLEQIEEGIYNPFSDSPPAKRFCKGNLGPECVCMYVLAYLLCLLTVHICRERE